MADISTYLDRLNDNGLRGYYIWHLFNEMKAIPPSDAPALIEQSCNFFRLTSDLSGECACLQHTYFLEYMLINCGCLHNVIGMYYVRLGDVNNGPNLGGRATRNGEEDRCSRPKKMKSVEGR
jgi:hypothetical protein